MMYVMSFNVIKKIFIQFKQFRISLTYSSTTFSNNL